MADEDKPVGQRREGETAKEALARNAERQRDEKAKAAIEKVRTRREKGK